MAPQAIPARCVELERIQRDFAGGSSCNSPAINRGCICFFTVKHPQPHVAPPSYQVQLAEEQYSTHPLKLLLENSLIDIQSQKSHLLSSSAI